MHRYLRPSLQEVCETAVKLVVADYKHGTVRVCTVAVVQWPCLRP